MEQQVAKKLKLDTLEVGMIFPNFKALLVEVGLQAKGEGQQRGTTRISNINLLKEFIEWEKIPNTNKVIITKVH